jgi:glycosyltransferase involved in cell wall biosynthesis
MSLIEAKHSGCYCIASALGGVPEVLQNGKYGKLIENPNLIVEWIVAIEDYLKGNYDNVPLPRELYTKEGWNEGMNILIETAKERFED